MAITFVGSLPPITALNGGNVTLTFSNLRNAANVNDPLVQGDIIVVAFTHSNTADSNIPTPAGWTEVSDLYANGTTYDTNLAVFYKVMGASPDTSVVLTGPTGAAFGCVGVAMAFRGVDPTTPMDVTATTATGTGPLQANPPAITPVTAGAFIAVIGAASAATGVAYTKPADLSATTNHWRSAFIAETNDALLGMGLKTDWVSGEFDPAAMGGSGGTANSWAATTLALRPTSPEGNASGTLSTVTVSAMGGAATTPVGISVEENTQLNYALGPTGGLFYDVGGGPDAAQFVVVDDGTSYRLRFSGFNFRVFETPADVGGDNVYDVIISSLEGDTNYQVTVTNVAEGGSPGDASGALATITVSALGATAYEVYSESIAEGAALNIDLGPSTDGSTIAVTGGVDAAQFTVANDGTKWRLRFSGTNARDFGAPADVGANNIYDVVLTYSFFGDSVYAYAITVTDVAEGSPGNASGALSAVTVSALGGGAVGAAARSAALASVTVSALGATATGGASRSAALSTVTLSALAGGATGAAAGNGALAGLTLSSLAGGAAGAAAGGGGLSVVTVTALAGGAVGGAVIPGNASGALVSVTASAMDGGATGEANATGNGPELVADPECNTLDGWTLVNPGGAEIVDGKIVMTTTVDGRPALRQPLSVTPGQTYKLSIGQITTAVGFIRVGSTPGAIDYVYKFVAGTFYFIPLQSTVYLQIGHGSNTVGATSTYDDISVTEVGLQTARVTAMGGDAVGGVGEVEASGALTGVTVTAQGGAATGGAAANGALVALTLSALAGGATGAANATGALVSDNSSALSGSATGGASTNGALGAVTVTALQGAAAGGGAANGLLSTVTLSAITGTASTGASASGALAGVAVTALGGTATGGASRAAALPGVTVTALAASATGAAARGGTLSTVTTPALAGTATGGAARAAALAGVTATPMAGAATGGAAASAALAPVTVTALSGGASGENTGNASGALAAVTITATGAAATGAATRGGALSTVTTSAMSGSAASVAPGNASGALSPVTVSALGGAATGGAARTGALVGVTATALGGAAVGAASVARPLSEITATPLTGGATGGATATGGLSNVIAFPLGGGATGAADASAALPSVTVTVMGGIVSTVQVGPRVIAVAGPRDRIAAALARSRLATASDKVRTADAGGRSRFASAPARVRIVTGGS